MSATVRQVVDDALELVGEVAGPGVQMYGDDRMRSNAIRAFDMLFKKYPWHQYRKWYRLQLDGVLGVVTTDAFEQVKDFEDFIKICRDAESEPIPMWPRDANPFSSAITSGGTQLRYWTSLHVADANYTMRRLQFYPVTATGFVNILTLLYPLVPPASQWDWEDTWYLDRALLTYATAFMTLVSDDLNTNAANVVKGMMNDKFNDIKNALSRIPKAIDPSSGVPTEWQEV